MFEESQYPIYLFWGTVLGLLCYLLVLRYARTPTLDFYSPMDLDDFERKRMRVYLGGLDAPQLVRLSANDPAVRELISFDPKHPWFVAQHPAYLEHKNAESIYDLMQIYERFVVEKTQLVKVAAWADSIDWHTIPTVAKARHIYAKTVTKRHCVLLRLRSRIHFGPIRDDTVPFDQKKNVVIWRGGPSGPGFRNTYETRLTKPSREVCLQKWCHRSDTQQEIDVGLTKKWQYENFKHYVKSELSITEFFQYKYLLSIEGNDVATNLKWALASNSVVLMPAPHVESWFVESLLKPYVHYVPVKNDFSDLYTQKQWCDKHPERCTEIIRQANAFVRPFRNVERDYYLSFRVLQRYMQWVRIVVESPPPTPSTPSTPSTPDTRAKKTSG
jgi:hypothetical protein